MPVYWLDSDVLIDAKNRYYAFDIAPGFWSTIQRSATFGIVKSPLMVYNELAAGGDELTVWASELKDKCLFAPPDLEVQARIRDVAGYVIKRYTGPRASAFLKGADPWVISSALATGGIVVTHEILVNPDSHKIKIPNVCAEFQVPYINSFELLRRLGAQLSCEH